jgi:hypothetical protein
MLEMTIVGVAAVRRGPVVSQSVDIDAGRAVVIWAVSTIVVVAAGRGVAINVCGGGTCPSATFPGFRAVC